MGLRTPVQFMNSAQLRVSMPSHDFDARLQEHIISDQLATSWEVLLVGFCSIITTSYTLHNELHIDTTGNLGTQVRAFGSGYFTFILDPPPAVLLGACIIEGCAISSFAYRRQATDKYQVPIFLLAISGATIIGIAFNIDANIIMLAVIPWSICFAMITSCIGHWPSTTLDGVYFEFFSS
ncbi:hypothetical protein HYFRA_00012848 [Hymenoscyphus fraxineus]|uniref:Uncharacterized protein n=1 Tax=Hymenoscyphus fraxineus TaxID=746836 RepID=A0A9N9L8U0_9HELO|nr:hypothetical protein HYFRA_00012848 [Hymenoscyphus fraxineus]